MVCQSKYKNNEKHILLTIIQLEAFTIKIGSSHMYTNKIIDSMETNQYTPVKVDTSLEKKQIIPT